MPETAVEVRDFIPYGYDERQYCSPGINLAVGCLSRTPYGEYPEYHTSADNLDFVEPGQLEGSYRACQSILNVLEGNATYLNRNPMCEPQLGRRGLYGSMGGAGEGRVHEMALLWVLNLSDGATQPAGYRGTVRPSVRVDQRRPPRLLEQSGLLEKTRPANRSTSTQLTDRLENTRGDV